MCKENKKEEEQRIKFKVMVIRTINTSMYVRRNYFKPKHYFQKNWFIFFILKLVYIVYILFYYFINEKDINRCFHMKYKIVHERCLYCYKRCLFQSAKRMAS